MKKFIIGFILGGIVSGVSTYFYVKKKDEDYISEEIKKVRDFYKQHETDDVLSEEEQEAIRNHVNKIPDKPIPEEYLNKVKDYGSQNKEDEEEPELEDDEPELEEDDEDEDDYVEAVSPPEDRPDIEIISVEEFGEMHYEEHALLYYTEDDCLCYEENEVEVDNRQQLLGDISEWCDNNDTEPLYVRNNRFSEDFEIIKVIGKFGDLSAEQ